ncbi:MAG: hypothetical protein ACI8PZ_006559 [Myxococcota bacterium]|jgi:hypothetical protein
MDDASDLNTRMAAVADRLRAIVDELDAHPDIDLKTGRVHFPVPDAFLKIQEDRYNIRFGPGARAFYNQCNGCDIEWVHRGEPYIDGRIQIIPHTQVLAGWSAETPEWHNDLWFDFMTPEQQAPLKKLKPFDYPGYDDSCCACFIEQDGVIDDALCFHSVDNGRLPLHIGLERYLELLLQTRGMAFFARFTEPVDKYMAPTRDTFIANLARLFPDVDPAPFKPPEAT